MVVYLESYPTIYNAWFYFLVVCLETVNLRKFISGNSSQTIDLETFNHGQSFSGSVRSFLKEYEKLVNCRRLQPQDKLPVMNCRKLTVGDKLSEIISSEINYTRLRPNIRPGILASFLDQIVLVSSISSNDNFVQI
jgi:hypothetical protein